MPDAVAGTRELSLETGDELYDVMVRLGDGASVESLDPLALQAAGIPEKYLASLLKLLGAGQMAKVKGGASRTRAEQVAERFVRAGLTVSVTPALNVQTLVHDERVTCPACSEHVNLTEDRKCPSCGVYVDKITPALLRKRKKIARSRERMAERDARQKLTTEDRLRTQAQAAIFRKHIRADLGGAYELVEVNRRRDRRRRARWIAASLAALAVALIGGGLIALGVSSKGNWPEARQRLLHGLYGSSDPAAPAAGEATAANAGSRVTLRSLALETALEQAARPQPVAGTPAPAAAPPAIGIGMSRKLQLALTASRTLAEAGHLARARDLLWSVKNAPELAAEPALASEARVLEIEMRARALTSAPSTQLIHDLPRLQDALGAIADPAVRAIAQARAGAVLGSKPHLASTARDMLTAAQSGLDAIGDAQRRGEASADWHIAKASALADEVRAQAASGAAARARMLASEIEALASKAAQAKGDAAARAQARVLALVWRAHRDAGSNADTLARTLDAFFNALEKVASPAARAATLRASAPAGTADARERVLAAGAAMVEAAPALPPGERFNVLADVSLAASALGVASRADELARLVFSAVSPQQTEATDAAARLLVERELAALRAQQGAAQFADAEATARRVVAYLR